MIAIMYAMNEVGYEPGDLIDIAYSTYFRSSSPCMGLCLARNGPVESNRIIVLGGPDLSNYSNQCVQITTISRIDEQC